ncbi:MAG: hypothetical protein ABGY24_13820 [bacterium]
MGININPSPSLDSGGLVAGRRLLDLDDPVDALSSSGFSYTVVTAQPGARVNGTTSVGEFAEQSVGSSFLSRIRAIRDAGDSIADADTRRLDILWNVLFWAAIAVVATCVLHAAIVLLMVKIKKVDELPKMLHFPRLELIVFMVVLPMICAAGSACLQSNSPGTLAAGVCLGILLPFGFILAASAFLAIFVVRPSMRDRRAYYVVCEALEASKTADALTTDATTEMAGGAEGGGDGKIKATARSPVDVAAMTDPASTRTGWDGIRLTGLCKRVYRFVLAPLFGFESEYRANVKYDNVEASHPVWTGKTKVDAIRVKRFGCLFEDAHGPQVFQVANSATRPTNLPVRGDGDDGDVEDPRVFISAEHSQTFVEVLQTFGVLFALTKMTLFATIVNASGGVNNLAQVIALVIVSLVHIVYLRMFVPYRLRVELAAEIVASTCDFGVFICGIILIAVNSWTTSMGTSMGIAMLVLQAAGFLVFVCVRVGLAVRTLLLTVFTRRI